MRSLRGTVLARLIGPARCGLRAQVPLEGGRYDTNLSGWTEVLRAELGGTRQMELSDRERRLAVFALLVIVIAAGLGTLGAVFSGFTFI